MIFIEVRSGFDKIMCCVDIWLVSRIGRIFAQISNSYFYFELFLWFILPKNTNEHKMLVVTHVLHLGQIIWIFPFLFIHLCSSQIKYLFQHFWTHFQGYPIWGAWGVSSEDKSKGKYSFKILKILQFLKFPQTMSASPRLFPCLPLVISSYLHFSCAISGYLKLSWAMSDYLWLSQFISCYIQQSLAISVYP